MPALVSGEGQPALDKSKATVVLCHAGTSSNIHVCVWPAVAAARSVLRCFLLSKTRQLCTVPFSMTADCHVMHAGIRSMQMASFLTTSAKFPTVYNVEGGIHAWATQIDPSVGVY